MEKLSDSEILQLIRAGESETVEFKTDIPPDHILARVLSAFANTKGGTLLIGVSDKGEIVGLTKAGALLARLKLQEITASLFPSPIETATVVVEGRNIVYAVVEKIPEIHYPISTSRGEFFQRELSHEVAHSMLQTSEANIEVKLNKENTGKELVAFVAMSFREEEEPGLVDYFKAMERAVKATNLAIKLSRIDLVEGDYEISQKVMEEIDKADIVIADLTLNPRNVYFELGYARGKPCRIIQTARKDTVLEFDIRNWRTIIYRNATQLEEKLIPELRAAYSERVE
jgi:predicted HTH transcriptional regulator